MGVPWMGGDSKMTMLDMCNLRIDYKGFVFLVVYSFPGYIHP